MVGKGRVGNIYKATDENGKVVALKLYDEQNRQDFEAETKVIKQLNHKRIIKILDSKSEAVHVKSSGKQKKVCY